MFGTEPCVQVTFRSLDTWTSGMSGNCARHDDVTAFFVAVPTTPFCCSCSVITAMATCDQSTR